MYTVLFTESFRASVDDLEIDRGEITATAHGFLEGNPPGFDLGAHGSLIRALDFEAGCGKKLRWFYMLEEEVAVVVNVMIVEIEVPARVNGDDILLLARLAEIAMKMFFDA